MALAFMNSAGVYQMVGYTVPTWYGYAGWGMLDYFVEQPGRFTLAEAFFANQQALIHRLATCFPGLGKGRDRAGSPAGRTKLPRQAQKAGLTWQDAQGLLYDRDSVAFYGDPAWEARMAPGPLGLGADADGEGRHVPFRDPAAARQAEFRADQHQRLAAGRPADRAVAAAPHPGQERRRSWKGPTWSPW